MRRPDSLSRDQVGRLVILQLRLDSEDMRIRRQRLALESRDRRRSRWRERVRVWSTPVLVTIAILLALAFLLVLISPRAPASPFQDAAGASEEISSAVDQVTDVRSQARAIAEDKGIPPRLFAALIQTESSWRVDARGAAGEVCLTQLLESTARELGVDPHDVRQCLEGGATKLRKHFDKYGDWTRALARYNGRGPMARAYAQRVLRTWEASE